MRYNSYPKVNLCLFIGEKKDKLHELKSIMLEVVGDVYDVLEFEFEEGNGIEIKSNVDIKNNIIEKAFNELNKVIKINKKIVVRLEKNIPMEAGVGGGSSNAATFLKAMNQLLHLDLTDKQLIDIAIKVGSDVPFFIKGHVALVEGIGEIVTSINCKEPKVEMKFNDFKFSTKEVFSNHIAKTISKQKLDGIITKLKSGKLTTDDCINDLEPTVNKMNKDFKKLMKDNPDYRLSGSGSTLFKVLNDV